MFDNDLVPAQPASSDGEGLLSTRSLLLDARIMMVDDDPLMTELIQTYLEDAGYTNFVVTNDPRVALDLLRREKPELLLLDLVMPQVSGFDLLEALRQDPDRGFTPVIVLTAATGADSKLRALRLGATDFLAKPVDESELVLRVRNTLAFQQYHERLTHFDQVTGLPNESHFESSLDEMLKQRAETGGLLALFSIAVPECRQLRESIGRQVSDGLANVLARRLEKFNIPAGMATKSDRSIRLARLDEQHFSLVSDDLKDINAVESTAKLILAALSEGVTIGPHEIVPTPWLGISMAPADGQSAGELRQSADLAATHARQAGMSQIAFASPELNARSYERLTLGAQLRHAAERGELRLHYQPKVELVHQKIVGVEALVRWQHPQQGLLPPVRFISLAEEMGLMLGLGKWVIEQACRDMADWKKAGIGEIKVSVNVSKQQVVAGTLPEIIQRALSESSLPPRQLLVELTESMLMEDLEQCLSMMHQLKEIGVSLSLDDFGTGYSSLAYLKKFPIDELKVDRSFVIDLPGQPADRAVVKVVVDLGHNLGMSVTAEGVETFEQLDCIKQMGCDIVQGYLFSKPLAPEQCAAFISSRCLEI